MSPAPKTAVEEVAETLHGITVRDPYRWLEDPGSERVRDWVQAQQAHSRAFLDEMPERDAVRERLAEALDCGSLGVRVPRGDFRFFTRRGAGMEQVALYVESADGAERVLVDPGSMSADGTTALDWWYPSKDGELVCFGVSEGGDEESTLQLVETRTGRLLPDRIPRCRLAAVAFEAGGEAILYTREPDPGSVPEGEEMYHRHLWRHAIGSDTGSDQELFGAGRDKTDFPAQVSTSKGGRWTAVTIAQGWSQSACFLSERGGEFRPIFEVAEKQLYVWFAGDRLLGITNLGAPNNRLVEIDPERPAPENWATLVAESEHPLEDAAVTSDRLLVHHLVRACSRISVHLLDGEFETTLPLPALSTVTGIGSDSEQSAAYVAVEGFTTPATVLRVDPPNATVAVIAGLQPPAGFDPASYPVRQVEYRSKDGTPVTMFLIGREAGPGPTLLTGYGGFNISRTPLWMPTAVPFLEAGGLVAVANLRGGGEYGEAWHRGGMRAAKQNVFDDFIAAALALQAHGHCSPGQLGILGGSNGGLLVGAAMTQRPDLFGAVVCRVPLLDMVRYEQFKVARLWAAEYGSAEDPEGFSWLYAYSPYHHVTDGVAYPPTLITTGEEDTRVDPLHARKMAARLQAASGRHPTLLRVEPRAGHGQGKPIVKQVPEEADVWAFLLNQLR